MASVTTRRDRCYLIGRRAAKLTPHQAALAWYKLAQLVEALGEKDVPKFNDLLIAFRVANLRALRPGVAMILQFANHWDPNPKTPLDLDSLMQQIYRIKRSRVKKSEQKLIPVKVDPLYQNVVTDELLNRGLP